VAAPPTGRIFEAEADCQQREPDHVGRKAGVDEEQGGGEKEPALGYTSPA
jgi:hypothetical protein